MAKPRRTIKFNHRNGHSTGADGGRRSSFSDISEAASEPSSPLKTGSDGALDVSRLRLIAGIYTDILSISSLPLKAITRRKSRPSLQEQYGRLL